MTPISERHRLRLYIYKKQKNSETIIYTQKARYFSKSKTIPLTFLFTKCRTLYVTRFHDFFEIGIYIYTKSMTLCVTWSFYIKKATHFINSNTICVTFFIYKKTDTLRYAIFHQIFKIGGGGWGFISKKQCTLR